eukprot:13667454-Ditylum_brightwellii.AAC.1
MAVFSVDTQVVVSLGAKSGGSKFKKLVSLSRKALSSANSVFFRHILSMKLKKREPTNGGKVSLKRKLWVLPATSSKKLMKLLEYTQV